MNKKAPSIKRHVFYFLISYVSMNNITKYCYTFLPVEKSAMSFLKN